jgi:putative Holliday junction resolvase
VSAAILAVDVGAVRFGIAICEDASLPAMPLATIAHTNREADAAAVAALARERRARTVVVGYPLRLDGSAGPAAAKIDRFIEALRGVFDGEVVAVDERLTTAAAAKKLFGGELTGSKRRRVIDQLAAVEILESYLAELRRRE